MRSTRIAVALGLVTAAGLLMAACDRDVAGEQPRTDGPMRESAAHGTVVRGGVGTRVTDGMELLDLGGTDPATIVSVRSVGGERALRYLGAQLAGPDRKIAAWAQLKGYPPTRRSLGEVVEAEGAVIQPRHRTPRRMGYELLLGFEVLDDDQVAWRSAVEVVYRVGETEYLWRSPGQLVFCPAGVTSQECFDRAGR